MNKLTENTQDAERPVDRLVVLPVGSRVQWQHWVLPRENAWHEAMIMGEPEYCGDSRLYPVLHDDGFAHKINLDSCANVRQAT